mgnify:CR=1 FL=1
MNSNLLRLSALAVLALALVLSACRGDDLNNQNTAYRDGSLNITVIHPESGTGPGFLVKAFHYVVNEEDGSRDYLATTNEEGVASFERLLEPVPTVISCTVPGAGDLPTYFAQDTVETLFVGVGEYELVLDTLVE